MIDDDPEEERTVFSPGPGTPPPPPEPTTPPAREWDGTAVPPPPTEGWDHIPRSTPPTSVPGSSPTMFTPRAEARGIQVGDVLNHIFEVTRFIARGGMGEVFEGVNVNSDERVAIKVMLPALAADANVISMFRKEARTLTRLQHEAVVQYRVLAQEPQLGVLYIVTEYIDGTNLSDVLGQISPGPAELKALLRRLAAGLRAAHELGAIHRDISPDNVLLADGRLDRAKIIDFGIAKDLAPGSATIVGDGFAGKLNYVAPEQLGDFGRQVGAWSDVYSLALVILAIAQGRNVQMGGSLVDAVDKRRAGVDLSGAPELLRPVLAKMLAPNPTDRLQTMDAVLAELDAPAAAPPAPPPAAKPATAPNRRTLLVGAAAAAVLLVAILGWVLTRGASPAAPSVAGPAAPAANADPVAVARSVVDSTLPSVACTWLSIVDIAGSDRGPLIKLSGVAGNPAAAQAEISRALAQRKIDGAEIDFENVSTITQSGCAALDTYRQVRTPDASRITAPQHKFEMRMQPPGSVYANEVAANAVIEMDVGDAKSDMALVGIEPSGKIDPDFFGPGTGVPDRKVMDQQAASKSSVITKTGENRYKMQLDVNHPGWSGILLITGQGPFDAGLIAPPIGARGPAWTEKFVSEAAAKGWHTDMVWFKTVDEVRE